ncbi:MAG: nitroreductase/quinone reductase family protein [Candidatus Nanopelagicales bacterium]
MADVNDWNAQVIAEFRANGGKVGGQFEGAPVVLMHHRGRKSGAEYVNPVMYMAADDDPATIYVFASKGGAPTHPDWYYNMTDAGTAVVEVGTETYDVSVTDVTGEDRDRIYAEQARRYPGFAEYEKSTEGIRTIPVLALTRVG